jgi:hypothetical protein
MPNRLVVTVMLAMAGIAVLAASSGPVSAAGRIGQTERHLAVAAKAEVQFYWRGIDRERNATWAWQKQALQKQAKTEYSERRTTSLRYLQWVYRLWQRRHEAAQRYAQNPPHKAAWQCLHSYEGAWTDDGGPYFGGLQMDISFQSHYGAALLHKLGTANNWTPLQQMWVAEKALRAGRGFYPWPKTARICGLL